ncbi:DUF6766 family protein [Spirosoma fluminis]
MSFGSNRCRTGKANFFPYYLSIVVLSIYLRQKGSPESKPVDASNDETGK